MSGRASRSEFHVARMDCAAEERLVRMALDGDARVLRLEFDLESRQLAVVHSGTAQPILDKLEPLKVGATLLQSRAAEVPAATTDEVGEARTLWLLLAINAVMFVIELGAGILAQSAGLIADSLDMFADAAVYGLSLYAVGRTAAHKLRAAHLSGWLQLALALGAFAEVMRRLIYGSQPEPPYMLIVAGLALTANMTCLYLIAKHREGGAHMRASWIFSTNDVLANLGVILAGILVAWTGSRLPDLVIGACIAALVMSGAIRILRLK